MIDLGNTMGIPVVAADGGGTRCRLAVRSGAGDVSVVVGSANVTTGFDAALSEMRRGLSALAAKSGFSEADLISFPAFFGLAGVTGKTVSERVAAALPLRRVRVTDDRPTALRGGLGHRDGVLVHCGTGSFFAMQQGGKTRFGGGWGPILGDQASAYWVGRRALSITLRAVDGLVAQSNLSRSLLERHKSAAGIVSFAAMARQAEMAAIAPLVTGLAQQGDPLAQSIMQEAGTSIATTARAMGWQPGLAICLTGGIAAHYAPYLPVNMQKNITQPLGEPLQGALSLAQDFSKEFLDERC
ncbi:ATPase [Tropicibacter sp. R15_0]|uniref:BadF/BadG/BcrA/BcrD ATPase family protein n=1 Tax=Tropicibacter sp. R15_0 TaxID=2821101 RepID=UPI001ADB53A0|nr:BadF/BadG/BcrA/BcrD ATPase family protein [Tropicibacter sp. R15_0]MBO9468174.1 ATPase [Tropicibacter sp. R15_0]